MNNLNLNPQIGMNLGYELCKKIEELPVIHSMQIIEDEDTSILEYIKSNYKKNDSMDRDFTKDYDLIFRTEVNTDPVIVFLTVKPFRSFALRIHNAFSPIPNSINKYLWTKYCPGHMSKAYVDTTKKCSHQIAELSMLYDNLKSEIEKFV